MGTEIVVDANIPLGLLLRLDWSDVAARKMSAWRRDGRSLVAPALWLYEAASGLRRAVSAKVLGREDADRLLGLIPGLDIQTVRPDMALLHASLRWADRLGQSKAYDAQYVALAESLEAELWSADERLVNGLKAQGVSWAHWIGEA